MKTDLANEVFAIVEGKVRSTPSPSEFEMAYQMRVAMDCIRFAIKTTEQPGHTPKQIQEAGLQLMDALDRLESADRNFQRRFRQAAHSPSSKVSENWMNVTAKHSRNGDSV
jgi:hypothetical protein